MVQLEKHPTVLKYRQTPHDLKKPSLEKLDSAWLRNLCLELGADDVGFVEIDRPAIDAERADILAAFPKTRSLISIIARMNREPIRSTARSIANVEFHQIGHHIDDVSRKIVHELEKLGILSLNPAMAFPMEVDKFGTGKAWVVSHKTVAVAAGRGQMGIHRNVIHPVFGSFVLLGTVLTEAELTQYDQPIDYNPCVECKLCVAACPTGAIRSDGYFNFSACYTHNYREFMGGFTDWVEKVADSKNALDYRKKVKDNETVSLWQSLSYGANYKAAHCVAVCPAGEDVIGPFLENRANYLKDVVKPLQDRKDVIYVVPGSDAEQYVQQKFPHKQTKRVSNGLRSYSISNFLQGLRLVFQPEKAKGLNATFHFTFTGNEAQQATVVIQNGKLEVRNEHIGEAKIHVTSDSASWLEFIRKERNLVWLLLRRKIRIKGSPKLLLAFGKCFPS
jgi:NAD-dependent dihydropyrimidine dehydrogenase PreA subunit